MSFRQATALLIATVVTIVTLTLLLYTLWIGANFERMIRPDLETKQGALSQALAARIERAVDLGIPLAAMVGVDEALDRAIAADGETEFLIVSDRSGAVLYRAGVEAAQAQAIIARLDRAVPSPAIVLRSGDGTGQEPAPIGGGGGAMARIDDFFVTATPIRRGDETVGLLHVGVDDDFVDRTLRESRWDTAIVLAVALLIAVELIVLLIREGLIGPLTLVDRLLRNIIGRRFTHVAGASTDAGLRAATEALNDLVRATDRAYRTFVADADRAAAAVAGPVRQAIVDVVEDVRTRAAFSARGEPETLTDSHLARARFLAFLFTFAEELTRPFLPLYLKDVAAATLQSDAALWSGLPITVFMLTSAIGNPIGAALADRLGRRVSFAIGAGLSSIGLVGAAIPFSYVDLVAYRGLSGLGYAFCLVACQGYVIDRSEPADRAKGIAFFVGGIISSAICGPAIGGVFADRMGYQGTLIIAALVAALAAAAAWILLRDDWTEARATAPAGSFGALARALIANIRFVAVALLAAVPAKALLTGYVFFLLPLVLARDGASEAEIGRIAMTYGLTVAVAAPVAAWVADRARVHALLVVAGGFVAAGALAAPLFVDGAAALLVATVGFGLGQAMSMASQLTLVTHVCRAEIASFGHQRVLGVFRLIERLGNAAGPVFAGLLAVEVGFDRSVPLIGGAAACATLLFCAVLSLCPDPAARRGSMGLNQPGEERP